MDYRWHQGTIGGVDFGVAFALLCKQGGFTVALAMWWLFYSRQSSTERNTVNAAMIVIRLALVFAVVIAVLHHLLAIPIATLLVPLTVAVLWSAFVS